MGNISVSLIFFSRSRSKEKADSGESSKDKKKDKDDKEDEKEKDAGVSSQIRGVCHTRASCGVAGEAASWVPMFRVRAPGFGPGCSVLMHRRGKDSPRVYFLPPTWAPEWSSWLLASICSGPSW